MDKPLILSGDTISYIALGDSYTIGTGASEEASWPVLLTQHLRQSGINIELTANPARNGFTTRDLIQYELPVLKNHKADFVTLLIGVNDWVQGVDSSVFHSRLNTIIDTVQQHLSDKSKLMLITIPDFGVTPAGPQYAYGRDISAGISEFNSIIRGEAIQRGLICVDIFEISKQMGEDSSLVASDGLHPSAKEYAIWETLILPEAKRLTQP